MITNELASIMILAIAFIIVLTCVSSRRKYERYPQHMLNYHGLNPRYASLDDGINDNNIYDTEQDTRQRGMVPYSNQPDHVVNRWKSHYSHQRGDNMGRSLSRHCSGMESPLWVGRSNMHLGNNSAMHLTSRFASE